MKFAVSTKPLQDGINLGIVNSNISEFYQKSKIAQISVTANNLVINLEARSIKTEIRLKGQPAGGESAIISVESTLFKRLVSTLTTAAVEFEFTADTLVLHSGKSKFTLPKIVDNNEVELNKPAEPNTATLSSAADLDKSDWKFVQNHQMYAKSDSIVNPVFTYVWVGENGDVMTGDYINSMFTLSTGNKLGDTCLLEESILNLFLALPDGAKIVKLGESYLVSVVTDSFEYITEFMPKYENEQNGNYNAPMIKETMTANPDDGIKVKVASVSTILNQATLFVNKKDPTIFCTVSGNQIVFKDGGNVDCSIQAENESRLTYSIKFNLDFLKSMINKSSEDVITLYPAVNNNEVVGIIVSSGRLTAILAGAE